MPTTTGRTAARDPLARAATLLRFVAGALGSAGQVCAGVA